MNSIINSTPSSPPAITYGTLFKDLRDKLGENPFIKKITCSIKICILDPEKGKIDIPEKSMMVDCKTEEEVKAYKALKILQILEKQSLNPSYDGAEEHAKLKELKEHGEAPIEKKRLTLEKASMLASTYFSAVLEHTPEIKQIEYIKIDISWTHQDNLLVEFNESFTKSYIRHCQTCHEWETTAHKLNHCGRCLQTFYCNQECQKKDWKRHKNICKVPIPKKCETCKKEENTVVKLNHCGRCLQVFYCNKECQQQDWSKHKTVCFKPTQ